MHVISSASWHHPAHLQEQKDIYYGKPPMRRSGYSERQLSQWEKRVLANEKRKFQSLALEEWDMRAVDTRPAEQGRISKPPAVGTAVRSRTSHQVGEGKGESRSSLPPRRVISAEEPAQGRQKERSANAWRDPPALPSSVIRESRGTKRAKSLSRSRGDSSSSSSSDGSSDNSGSDGESSSEEKDVRETKDKGSQRQRSRGSRGGRSRNRGRNKEGDGHGYQQTPPGRTSRRETQQTKAAARGEVKPTRKEAKLARGEQPQ